MKKTILLLTLSCISAHSAVIAQYDINNDPTALTGVAPTGITASNLTSPSFALAANVVGVGFININEGAGLQDGTTNNIAGAFASNQFVTFTVTAAPGCTLDLTSLDFSLLRASQGPQDYAVRSSVDGFASNIVFADQAIGPSLSTESVALTGAAFQGLSTITFQIAFDDRINNTSSNSAVQLHDIVLNGEIIGTHVPEPSSAALLALGGLALVARRKRA